MKAVIFLGPSLPLAEARQVLDAVYLPPATQSDLLSEITTYQPDVIGLIDGVFMQLLSVCHKEIPYALERGVRVYGSSSMGALRAAETDVFGMVGVGEVYRQYASGEINDDDEVAVLHSDADFGYRAPSEPMVNLRATFRRAAQEDVIDDETCRQLVGIAKALYFPERSYAAIFQQATVAGLPDDVLRRMRQFIATSPVDLKRQDALQLLQIVRDLPDPLPQMDATFTMTRSHLFAAQFDRDRTVRHREVDGRLATSRRSMQAVSEGISTLSGGQRQRLMIARALVSKPRVVFFDEATSALDNHTQAMVSRSLEALQATRIVIAHRLSTIRMADHIYVIRAGRIVQSGTYDELIADDGPFLELAKRQLA